MAVALGVALVQASLVLLLAAAQPEIPAGLSPHDELVLRDAYEGAVSLSAIIMGITTFVAVFVVGSTFAFTVAQRRRDLALLRLTGAAPRQVRRLLLGEAVLLGAIGTLLGVLLGVVVARLETRMFASFDFVPSGFTAPWRWWVLAVSAVAGIGIAVVGCLAASHRASKVRALDALRQVGTADRVMTPSRWAIGLLATAGALAFVVASASSQGAQAMDTAVPACLLAVVALSALSPVVVPLVGAVLERLTTRLMPGAKLGELIHANLRDGVRRTASTAAPVILLVGLVLGLAGTVSVIDAGRLEELERTVQADLVVVSPAPIGDRLAGLDGVRAFSEEAPVLIEVPENDPDAGLSYSTVEALAADPASYALVHGLDDRAGLEALSGASIALDRSFASALGVGLGDELAVRVDGDTQVRSVAALLPESMTGPDAMVPLDLAAGLDAEWRYLVQTEPGQAPAVAGAIAGWSGSPAVSVSDRDEWVHAFVAERRQVSQNIIVAILGLATLYVAIAVVNAVVIAGANRREEFATARLTGLSRAQVIRATVWESLAVAAVGVVLGGAAAALTLAGVSSGVSDVVGTRVVTIPWLLVLVTVVGVAVTVAVTSALTTAAATREPAIAVAGARE